MMDMLGGWVNRDLAMFLVGFVAIRLFKRWMTKTFVEPVPVPADPDAPPTLMGRCWARIVAADAALVAFLQKDPPAADDDAKRD